MKTYQICEVTHTNNKKSWIVQQLGFWRWKVPDDWCCSEDVNGKYDYVYYTSLELAQKALYGLRRYNGEYDAQIINIKPVPINLF